jgi:molecular chaperone DnaJ
LGLDRTATAEDIKKAYRRLAKQYNPDALASMGKEVTQEAQQQFRKIQEAYDRLSKAN